MTEVCILLLPTVLYGSGLVVKPATPGVAATGTFQAMYSHILSSSEASPTFGHANANINYHYSFL